MSGASKNRKYRAAHEASIRRASEEIKIQKAYISFYHQFNSGSPGIASRGTRHIMTPYQNYGPASRGSGRGAVGSPLDSFSWVTPDSYRQRISTAQGTTNVSSFGMNAASYKSIADMLRPKAINAELSNLSGAYTSQSQLIKKGPQKAKSKRNRGSNQPGHNGPSAVERVLLSNQKGVMNSTGTNLSKPNTSDGSAGYQQFVGTITSGKDAGRLGVGVANQSYFDSISNAKPTQTDEEKRNEYLSNFGLTTDSKAGPSPSTGSARSPEPVSPFNTKEYSSVMQSNQTIQNLYGWSDDQLVSNLSKSTAGHKTSIGEMNRFKLQLTHLNKNRKATPEWRSKLASLKSKIQEKFPNINTDGTASSMITKLDKKITQSNSMISSITKKQDAMGLYQAKEHIQERRNVRERATQMQNQATQKEIDKAKQVADQKEYDELWTAGAGSALMSHSSINNLNPDRMVQAPSKASELTRVVGIVKKYDAWDQRRNYISGELDTRRSNLNTYYNSNWEQDFTVSDTEASQYMFGSDTPSGTSLTRNAVTAIGINQRKPRKAIENINKILAQTGENRSVYAENLAGIETKLLTLKEKQALKKAENDAIKARIAQQVTDDFNAGNVDINTTFRDSITGTSEELYDLNTQVAEHNTIKTYYDKSLAQTDEDTATLKNTLEEIIKVKQQNDYDTITSGADGDGGNKSQSSLGGYNKARRFKRPTGGRKQMVRSGGGKIQRTRSGKGLSGLVI